MGTTVTELELPYPPSVNHYYRRVGQRTLISREGRRFRQEVCSLLAAAGVKPITGPLRVEIDVYPPDRRRRDVDNLQKGLLDALEHGGLYRNDGQIADLRIIRCECVPGGRTVVRIWRI